MEKKPRKFRVVKRDVDQENITTPEKETAPEDYVPDNGGPTPPDLPKDKLLFLMELEGRAKQFQTVDMKKAMEEYEAAQAKLQAIHGALQGLQIILVRTLDEHGVTQETYVRQREDYLKSQSIAEGSQVLA